MSPRIPIDPLAGAKAALQGRIVTVDGALDVLDQGVLYLDGATIVAVQRSAVPPPAGFEHVAVTQTHGTVYPGLIELHNHLAYDALPLWDVPKTYTNRDQWGSGGNPQYRPLISGPMKLIGPNPQLMPAVVRYVECKALVGGTTTTQGLEIFSNKGARRLYRGNIRNVEVTDDPALPGAGTRIGDVDAASAENFLKALGRKRSYLLHLSEGIDDAARNHFLALKIPPDTWAVADSLAGIHCAALRREDFDVLAAHGASMVWSPLSNLLLYGKTADVAAAKAAGVKIGLGSDWSPSGSKHLLGELKVARIAGAGIFSDAELVTMATRTAAEILRWDGALGTLEAGKRADLLVIDGAGGDPYAHLLQAGERAVTLVMVGGRPRFGTRTLVEALGGTGLEALEVGGRKRVLNLRQETADPAVGALTLAEATARLTEALHDLPALALAAEQHADPLHALQAAGDPDEVRWGLALDELEPTGVELRPRVPLPGSSTPTGPSLLTAAPAPPLSSVIGPIELDGLTVADEPAWLDRLDHQRNLPAGLADGVRALF